MKLALFLWTLFVELLGINLVLTLSLDTVKKATTFVVSF